MKFLKTLWADPVWSKVIAAIIVVILGTIYSLFTSRFNNQDFITSFINFWNVKIELWRCLLLALLIVIVFLLVSQKKQKQRRASQPRTILSSLSAEAYELKGTGIQIWDGKASIGEFGRGDLTFEKGIITLKRHNKNGRYMIIFDKYLTSKGKDDYVRSNIHGPATRVFLFSYDARVINGKHHLVLAAIKNQGTKWLSNKGFDIKSPSWEKVQDYLRIPATEDFILAFEDNYLENEESTVQITNLVIEEILA